MLLVGTVRCSVPLSRPKALAPVPPDTPVRAEMARLLRESQTAFHAGEWERAATLFRQGYEISSRAGERRVAVRCLSNLGACRLAQHRTREALDILLEALPVARAAGDDSLAGTLEFNISSLYTGLSERETAVRYAEMALRDLRGEERRQHLPKLLIHLGTLRAQQGRMAEALELFRQGIQGADAAADLEAYTTGCSRLGEAYLQRGDLARAEPPLLEAFRIRKLDRLPALESSYRDLGQLRLAQGDYRSAFSLLDAAIERSARPGSPLPSWDLYQARGRALLALGPARSAHGPAPAAFLAARRSARGPHAHPHRKLAATGIRRPGRGRRPALFRYRRCGAGPGDLRGRGRKPGRQPARAAGRVARWLPGRVGSVGAHSPHPRPGRGVRGLLPGRNAVLRLGRQPGGNSVAPSSAAGQPG